MSKRKQKRSASGKARSKSSDEPASHSQPAPQDPSASQQPDAASAAESSNSTEVGSGKFDPISLGNGGTLPPLSRILSVVMLILGIVVVGALFLKVMAGFFVPLFLAALLVVIFRPVHQWFVLKTGDRPRLAALMTTGLVLAMVLLPVIALISVATSQFTSILTHVKNFDDLEGTFDRARSQLGISLEYPQQFRRLDELSDTLSESIDPETGESVADDRQKVIKKITEATSLLQFLHQNVDGPPYADADADKAVENLNEYRMAVEAHLQDEEGDLISTLDTKDQFNRQSVIAAAAIRAWMRTKLGGTFRSQLCLIANPSAEDFHDWLRKGREVLQPRFVSLTSSTGEYIFGILVGTVVLVVAVYFFLVDGSGMVRTLMRLSPLDDEYEEQLLVEFERTSRAVVLASVLSALAQGVLAAFAFWLCGFDSIILLFLITSLMALVPFLGAASVWVPAAIYLAAVDQRYLAAVPLTIFGLTVISMVDNLIKPLVLQGKTTLHPLFALLSVLGGLSVFGPVGLVVGPMVVVFLQTLLEILSHELAERDAAAERAKQTASAQD